MAADLPPTTPDAAPPAAVVAPAPAQSAPIYVDGKEFRYAVTGNTLLPQETIEAILRDAATPKDGIDALNRAYQQAGYLFVVIGGQVNNKLVAVQVLQGRIAEIDAPAELLPYIKGLADRDDITRSLLLRESAMADLYSARQGMRPKADFAKSAYQGGTKLVVTEEPIPGAKPWNAGLSFGNFGSRYSSRYTAAANGAVRPGGGLEFSVGYTQGIPGLSDDSAGSSYRAAVLGASLVTPWGIYALSYSKTVYGIGEIQKQFEPGGEIEMGGITGTQLVYTDEVSRVTLTQGLTQVSNNQTVFGGEVAIVQQNYGVASLGATYNRAFVLMGQNASFGAGITALQGFSPRSGTFLPDGPGVPNQRFSIVQANATVTGGLPAGFTAGFTVSGQYTEDTVPQNQQWVLGGFGNLSAWLPAALIGDSGALARFSVSSPPYRWGEFNLSGVAFAEAGTSRYSYRPATDPYSRALADAGLSLTGATNFGTTLTLAYAWPVWYRNIDTVTRRDVDQSRANLYFTLNQAF